MQPHPQLRPQVPVLDRGDGELQVGTDTGLVLHSVGRREQRLLALLDGNHSLAELAAASGLDPTEVHWLLERLAEADLLMAPPSDRLMAPPSGSRPLVRLLGAGTLARAFAEAYATADVGPLLLVEPEPAPAGLYADPRPSGAESLRAHLRARGHQQVRCTSHWYRPEGPNPDLTVIGYDRLECDRAITDTLLRTDQPHLFLRPLVDGVIIGPLVMPGRTCCTRCMDLVRTRDRAWPRLLTQLCRTACTPSAELADWAAATTLLQIRSWLAGEQPEVLGATLEVRAGRWTFDQRSWPLHPDCGCSEVSLRAY
jgi:hypothetical protein